jgi:hypothetical protein
MNARPKHAIIYFDLANQWANNKINYHEMSIGWKSTHLYIAMEKQHTCGAAVVILPYPMLCKKIK